MPAEPFEGLHGDSERAPARVPVGGVGTGGVEFGADARFRNVSVNNNRATMERIPLLRHTFLAVRVRGADTVYMKRLQRTEPGEAPLPGALPPLEHDQHVWRGIYPSAHYRLEDPACPVTLMWSHFAPVIPFDHDCSTMPVIFTGVRVENTGTETVDVSTVFHVENFVGRTMDRAPSAPPPGRFLRVGEEESPPVKKEPPAADNRPTAGNPPCEPGERHAPRNAVQFGAARSITHNADGEHLFALREIPGLEISSAAYDPGMDTEARALWRSFEEHGSLPGTTPGDGIWRCAAVCGAFRLEPGETRRFDFVFAWFCPRFEHGGHDLGVACARTRPSAVAVARHALQYVEYFHRSVSAWQTRLLSGSLPRWFNRLLVNSAHALTTNAICGLGETFGLVDSPDNGLTACLDSRIYSSLGSLLFFPRFSESELAAVARAEQPQPTGRLPRCLGTWSLDGSTLNHPVPERVRLAAHFTLMACRDYLMTGNAARSQAIMPTLRTVMAAIAALDRDADGLPDCEGMAASTFDDVPGYGLNCIDAGLWVAALPAYARLCEAHHEKEDAQRFGLLGKRAAAAFERIYWREEPGYYRLFPDGGGTSADTVHTAQLAGAWYAEFLGIDGLFDLDRVDRALAHIAANNAHEGLMPAACLPGGGPYPAGPRVWPGHLAAHYAALLIYRGRVAEGMSVLEKAWTSLTGGGGLYGEFNMPLCWDPVAKAPSAGAPMRHAAVLAVWHVLYAIEGFMFQVPGQHLRIMPNLPPGISSLNAPLITPVCLGWLNYRADRRDGYRQRLRVRLESPIQVRSLELRIPADVQAVRVSLREADNAPVPITRRLHREGDTQRLHIAARHPQMVASDIFVEVTACAPEEGSAAREP